MSMRSEPTQAEIDAWLVEEDRHTARMIREYGVYIQYVFGEPEARATSFAYTVGLFGVGHPELVMLGVADQTAGHLLNEVARRVRSGTDLVAGEVLTFEGWSHRVMVETLPNPGQIVFAANSFYQRPDEFSVPAFQLTYDDRERRFPWEDGYSIPAWVQPRPGEFRA